MTEADLLNRLEKLERDNRRLKRSVLVALVIVGLTGTIAASRPTPKAIRAHEFDVVDNSGNVRATMNFIPSGESGVAVYDAKGHPRAVMAVAPSGSPSLALSDSEGRGSAGITILPSGKPVIVLSEGGKAIWQVP